MTVMPAQPQIAPPPAAPARSIAIVGAGFTGTALAVDGGMQGLRLRPAEG